MFALEAGQGTALAVRMLDSLGGLSLKIAAQRESILGAALESVSS